jgi:hypothetical protein
MLLWDEHLRAGDLRALPQESFSSLTPGVHLVIIRPIRESRAFRDESLHHGISMGCGKYQFPDSSWGLAAAARESLPPSGFTSTKPPI